MPDGIKNFWQVNVSELRENKLRFAVLFALLLIAVGIAFLENFSGGGEEIILTETPAQIPQAAEIPTIVNESIETVDGANDEDILIYDPFKMPPPEDEPEDLPPPPFWIWK